jgi:hypothetical protein
MPLWALYGDDAEAGAQVKIHFTSRRHVSNIWQLPHAQRVGLFVCSVWEILIPAIASPARQSR